MYILGIWDGHDSGAAIIEGNRILVALNEERLTRRKLEVRFPHHAIRECLQYLRLHPADIKHIAVSSYDFSKTLARFFPSSKEAYYLIRRRKVPPGFLNNIKKRAKYRLTELGPIALTRGLSELWLKRTLDRAGFRDQIQAAGVATFSSALTLSGMAAPTNTATPTVQPSPTLSTPPTTSAGGIPLPGTTRGTSAGVAGGVASTASCYGLTFVTDESIPDNTQMDPGKSFTKTWKVQNSGSCAWDAGFKFQNTGGEAIGSTFSLPSSVPAGQTFDISVPMTAPNKTGTLRSNWRMSTANGQFFGDEVYVVIVVGNASAPAATNTSAPAAEATNTTSP